MRANTTLLEFEDLPELQSQLSLEALHELLPIVRLAGNPVRVSPHETWCCSRAADRARGQRVVALVGHYLVRGLCWACHARVGLLVYRLGQQEKHAYVPEDWPGLWAAEELAAEARARGFDPEDVTAARAAPGGCHGWHCCLRSLRELGR